MESLPAWWLDACRAARFAPARVGTPTGNMLGCCRGPKWATAQVKADLLLMGRDGGLALGLIFYERDVEGDFMGDENERIV